MIVLLLAAALGQADEDVLLAPTLADLDRGLARAERLLTSADDEVRRLGAAQAEWVTLGCVAATCAESDGVRVAVAVQAAGHRTRELVQGTRAELDRLLRIESASTVAPLVDDGRRRRLDALRRGATAAARNYQVRVAWYQRFVAPWTASHARAVAAACASGPAATPAPSP